MLDTNLLAFVEPIGYGQIVDRECLVALPVGSIKISISNTKDDVIVHVMEFRERYTHVAIDPLATRTSVKAYIWQDGVVVSGNELNDTNSLIPRSRRESLTRRSAYVFRFRKQPESIVHNDMVHGVLQICAYNTVGGKLHPRKKQFIGTVHIALKCLTCYNNTIQKQTYVDWYKVFPKSSMLPGSPSDIAKTNCYISGETVCEDLKDDIIPEELPAEEGEQSITSSLNSSHSTVSFDLFHVKRRLKKRSLRRRWFSVSEEKESSLDRNDVNMEISSSTVKNITSKRDSIFRWLRNQKSLEENISEHSRRVLEDSISLPPITSSLTPPFIVATSTSSISASKRSSCMSSCSNTSFTSDSTNTSDSPASGQYGTLNRRYIALNNNNNNAEHVHINNCRCATKVPSTKSDRKETILHSSAPSTFRPVIVPSRSMPRLITNK